MSAKARIALTFLLVVLAVVIWGASQIPIWYDRGALGGGERVFAACLFVLAIALNLPDAVKRKKRPQAAVPDYYVHFDETPHGPARRPRAGQPAAAAHPGTHHPGASASPRTAHPGHDHQYDRQH